MTGVIRQVETFHINGWEIRPCSGEGFDLVHGEERYHHDHLEVAVAAAQASTRTLEGRIKEMLGAGQIDVLRIARDWVAELDQRTVPAMSARKMVVEELIARIDRYERDKPSWKDGTPEEYDRWLAELVPDEQRLKFYQWIGMFAGHEVLTGIRNQLMDDPTPVQHQHWDATLVHELMEPFDPYEKDADPLPSVLPPNPLRCVNKQHTHTDGSSYRPACREEG